MKSLIVFSIVAVLSLVTIGQAQVDFSGSPLQYYVGGQPWSVFCADLDGDGYQDMATVSYQTDSLTILLNDGDGTFSFFAAYSTGDVPAYVHGDYIDADSAIDLAVSNSGDGTVSVFINYGDGTFEAPVTVAVGTTPTSVRLADFNGDGHPDLVVTNEQITMPFIGDSVSVLLNNGDGTFQARISFEVGYEPQETVAVDLNGDSSLDLAVVNLMGHNISVLLNDGSGSFSSGGDYESHHMPTGVSAADLDNDGDQDLIAPNSDAYDRSVVSVILNNGDGSFQATVYYNSGGAPLRTFVSDLDKDNDIDIVVANWTPDSVSILLNNGDATFAPPIQYLAGDAPSSLFTADMNNDSYDDLAVANRNSNDLLVYINQGAASSAEDQQTVFSVDQLKLAQNFPNPFNPATAIEYSLERRGHVNLAIYNTLGQRVATLVDEEQGVGSHRAQWSGTDSNGEPVANGVYFYRLTLDGYALARKMLLIK